MLRYVQKVWFRRRWKVYEMGHSLGDERWLATFRYEQAAWDYARAGRLETT